ncbi:hypothetical protein JQ615_36385 [Bradyrhizobium jicamae]|uniref:Right handed beta helix domain-containing protein n=1 Tax=Bradyrhizobium jicamae TaxID=280332 RepID=A0ABS5FVH9_9BRAD|nr:right-handed parallel beta-helix repeat-containing protein [Bradyrhizobium jicamae]MBR0800854.1 hypothetical protein [Bradyrhizobium jicamae]
MRLYWSCLSALLLSLISAMPVHAQATRTWVSGVGDDANPCSRTAPCKTFAGAISKTAPGGEIDALDPGGFGAVTITKSITIDGGGGQVASILVAGTNGINVAAGASDVVVLKNLRFQGLLGNGGNPANSGQTAISFSSGGALVVDKCEIYGFANSGISASTSGAGTKLFVTNTTITNAATGISVVPTGGDLSGQIDRVNIQVMSTAGVNASGPANVTMSNSTISNAATGVTLATGSILGVDSSQINNNATGIATAGGFVRISRNVFYDNNANFTIAGGTIASAGNNILADNGATIPNGSVTQR